MPNHDKPRVVLGLLTFGPPESEQYGARVTDLEQFEACLDYFQSQGYNEVDTARTYVHGLQESFTKQANWQSRGLSLSTKWYPHKPGENAASMVKAQLTQSLEELGAEQVDIFYLHAPDRTVPFEETLQACNELHQAGKFKRLGISNYAAWEVAEICTIARERGWIAPTVCQAMYNALTRAIEDELIPCCRKFGIEILAYNPLAGGVLSGKYKTKDAPPAGLFSESNTSFGQLYRDRYFRDTNFEALRLLEPLAVEHGLTLAQIAYRWCAYHSKLQMTGGGRDGLVFGVSSLTQLQANLEILGQGRLPDAIVQALDEAWEKLTKTSCPSYWR